MYKHINFFSLSIRFCLLLYFVFICNSVFSQKVAVVLSGGGAKGLAHAGALQALEENNIPIDYIAGTSMGAIVGGFYAAGHSSREIMEIASSVELQEWIKNIPKKEYRHIQMNNEQNPSWLSLKLSIDSSFSATFRTSFSQDHFLNFELIRKFASATRVCKGNFDNLFVPYRSTASEIFTEKAVVFRSGSLFEAARASMAVPFFYRPIRVNNQLMFDGGIYNNFPVETAKQDFKPNVVIGVNVASKKLNEYPYDKDHNLIAESILFAILDKTDSTEIGENDIFIDVELQNHHALDFKEASRIIQLGYNSTMKKMAEIKSKVGRRVDPKELEQKRQSFKSGSDEILFDSLKINGFKPAQQKYIEGRFDPIRPISLNEIEEGYTKIVSNDYFANIFPSYSFGEKNTFILSGNPNPKLKGKIGGSLVSRNMSQLYVGFDFNRLTKVLTHYSLGVHTGRFYQSVNLRSKVQFPGKLNLSLMPEFIYNRWNFISTTDLFSKNKNPEIQDRNDNSYGLNFDFPLFQKIKFNFHTSYFYNTDRFSNDGILVSSDTLDVLRLKGGKIKFKFHTNSLNFHQYPYKGEQFGFCASFAFGREDYSAGNTSAINSYMDKKQNWYKIGLVWEKYLNSNKYYDFGFSFSAIYSNQPAFGTLRSAILNQPSFDPLQDSKTLILEKFRGRKYMTAGIKNIFHLANSLHLRIEGYSIYHPEQLSGKLGNVATYHSHDNFNFSGTAGLVFQSLIGPISLSLNYYDRPSQKWGGLLHVGYLLFNKKSLD